MFGKSSCHPIQNLLLLELIISALVVQQVNLKHQHSRLLEQYCLDLILNSLTFFLIISLISIASWTTNISFLEYEIQKQAKLLLLFNETLIIFHNLITIVRCSTIRKSELPCAHSLPFISVVSLQPSLKELFYSCTLTIGDVLFSWFIFVLHPQTESAMMNTDFSGEIDLFDVIFLKYFLNT